MRVLKISVAGVRGIIGQTLTPELLVDFGQAFGTYLGGGRVLLSCDTRRSGPMVSASVRAGLMAAGCEVVDLGICPTAALQLAIKDSPATGGIAVTAGHNDASWNALKFIRDDGIFLNPRQSEELLDIYHLGRFSDAHWDELRPLQTDPQAGERHLEAVLAQVDRAAIRARDFTVAVDCANGACSLYTPRLLEALGCRVVAINTETHLPFPHPPQPSPENLSQLQALVRATDAAVGFAHDADGDRLGVVSETGAPAGEEATMCLCTEMILRRGDPGSVVTNYSTSLAVEEVARRYGRVVHRTGIGQAFITEAALNYQAAIAGEGSGGVVFPRLNYAHDGQAAMVHVLNLMAQSGASLSELIAEVVPRLVMAKRELPCPSEQAYSVLQRLRQEPEPAWVTDRLQEDGLLLRGDRRWVHVRVSQTEPIIRVIVETPTAEETDQLLQQYLTKVRRAM
ncbi:MAG TPA: phosphoglucosamine mutase [Armatimonadota bacterium]|jgi:phosphomannomutase